MNTLDSNPQTINETRHGQVAGQLNETSEQVCIVDNDNTVSPSDQLRETFPQLLLEPRVDEDLGSDACPWLDEYIKFSRKWSPESYDGYHEACGLFVLSTIAARRVIFNLGGVRATNLNILLVGRTSVHAKSTAAEIGIGLLRAANLDWLIAPDEITPQKLIESMSSNVLPANINDLEGNERQRSINRILTAGQRGWFLDEFGGNLSSMMQPDSVMSGIKGLIRILDGAPPYYDYSTISRGQNLVFNPYLPILGNITIADFVPYARKGNTLWGDGFISRFAMVVPSANYLNFGEFPNQERVFPESLISPLVDWNERLGFPEYRIVESEGKHILIFQPTTPAPLTISQAVFKAYYKYRVALRIMIVNSHNHDFDGNYARLPEKALRIAALFASIGGYSSIELNHWAKAQAIAERWRIGLHELYRQLNDTNLDQQVKFVRSLPIEDQVLRAVAIKKMLDIRGICQFTHLKADIVRPAVEKLVSDYKLEVIDDNGNKRFVSRE